MKPKEYWEKLVSENREACFLANCIDKKIFFLNGTLEKMFNHETEILGKSYLQVLTEKNYAPMNQDSMDWNMEDDIQVDIYHKETKDIYRCSLSIFPNSSIICCFMIPLSHNGEVRDSFEDALTRCISVLNKEDEEKNTALLEILGRYYDCDKTYLYQIDQANQKIPCICHWTKDETVTHSSELSDKMNPEKLFEWYKSRNEIGIIDASKDHSPSSSAAIGGEILENFLLENLVSSIIEDSHHQVLGMLSMGNRRNVQADFRLLLAVTKFMEQSIMKIERQFSSEQQNDRDILTGFYNRTAYASQIDQLREDPPNTLGVLLANVNGLKKVNTEFGYAQGDHYIKQAAETIKKYFSNTFYRVAGDEFVAFFPDVDRDSFEEEISILQRELKEKYNHHFAVGHAWGEGRYDCSQLIGEADTVMYINKQEYYHSSHVAHDDITDNTLSDLLSYLEDKEFMIYLQPQVRLKDGSLYAAEALIRRFDKKK